MPVNRAPLLLMAVLLPLMLASCAQPVKEPPPYVVPKLDCAIFDAPLVSLPALPAPTERDPTVLWTAIYGLQTYAEGVLGQRLDSAACVSVFQRAGVVR